MRFADTTKVPAKRAPACCRSHQIAGLAVRLGMNIIHDLIHTSKEVASKCSLQGDNGLSCPNACSKILSSDAVASHGITA